MTSRRVEVLECSIFQGPDGRAVHQFRAVPGPTQEVAVQGVDEALAQARALVEGADRRIRAINMKADGHVRVIVWPKGYVPKSVQIPGFVWRRPASSES